MRFEWRARIPEQRDLPSKTPHFIHDGDTLWLEIDRGDRDKSIWSIRLLSVFAPEIDQPGGTEAREKLVDWTQSAIINATGYPNKNWPFKIETFKVGDAERKSFERYLATLNCAGLTYSANEYISRFLSVHREWGKGTT